MNLELDIVIHRDLLVMSVCANKPLPLNCSYRHIARGLTFTWVLGSCTNPHICTANASPTDPWPHFFIQNYFPHECIFIVHGTELHKKSFIWELYFFHAHSSLDFLLLFATSDNVVYALMNL